MSSLVPPQVDPISRTADPGNKPFDELCLRAHQCEDGAVVVGIGVHIE